MTRRPTRKVSETKRILHVEDGDFWHREVLEAAPKSWRVDHAPDKTTALRLLAEMKYDGAILDIEFPQNRLKPYERFDSEKPNSSDIYAKYGITIAGHLQKNHPEMPVVVYSASQRGFEEMQSRHGVSYPFIKKHPNYNGWKEAVRVLKLLLRKRGTKRP